MGREPSRNGHELTHRRIGIHGRGCGALGNRCRAACVFAKISRRSGPKTWTCPRASPDCRTGMYGHPARLCGLPPQTLRRARSATSEPHSTRLRSRARPRRQASPAAVRLQPCAHRPASPFTGGPHSDPYQYLAPRAKIPHAFFGPTTANFPYSGRHGRVFQPCASSDRR